MSSIFLITAVFYVIFQKAMSSLLIWFFFEAKLCEEKLFEDLFLLMKRIEEKELSLSFFFFLGWNYFFKTLIILTGN